MIAPDMFAQIDARDIGARLSVDVDDVDGESVVIRLSVGLLPFLRLTLTADQYTSLTGVMLHPDDPPDDYDPLGPDADPDAGWQEAIERGLIPLEP